MKVLMWCDNLATRRDLEAAWMAAGLTVLKKNTTEVPDCIVIDMAVRNPCVRIAELRAAHPQVDIIAFASKFDAEAFAAAQEAGATEMAAQNSIVERVTRRAPR